MTDAAATAERYLAFRAAGRRYALPAQIVSEVVAVPAAARLPLGPDCLLGLANLRGLVVPVVSLAVLLGRPAAHSQRAIVLGGATPMALPVEAVERLETVDPRQVEPLAAEAGEALLGAYRHGEAQVVTRILDIPALLAKVFSPRRPSRETAAAVPDTADARDPVVAHRLLISFDVAGQSYALPLQAVREIGLVPATVSVVPRADAALLGVVAWRDGLLPLMSLRALLGFPPLEAPTGREKVIVVIANGSAVGLVADRADALLRAEADAIDPAPPMLVARTGGEARIAAIWRGGEGRLVSVLAPDRLFREDMMARLPDVPPRDSAGRQEAAAFVVFRLGQEEFGLPIDAVAEVARVPAQVTRVPRMPRFLEGLANLRGEVLPVVDLRRRFGMPAGGGAGQRMLVVRAGDHRAGLIVDAVHEVLRTSLAAIQAPPELAGAVGRLVNGVVSADGPMVLLLDPTELLTGAERRDLGRLAVRQ